MPEDRSALDHLLEGREALQREVDRLTAAIEQLDSVLERIGTTVVRVDPSAPDSAAVGPQPVTGSATQPVTVPAGPRVVRRAPARKPARARGPEAPAAPPKSIRVHVLEMLQAEDREFGLAEIIDRVHAAGIPAHDDAVRSITIKLMKDGGVERVGRGQYRLARLDPTTPAASPTATPAASPTATPAASPAAPVDSVSEADEPAPTDDAPDARGAYAPSLNLGQPWNT